MKCSSTASQQESKHAEPTPQMIKHQSQNYTDGDEWITSASKKKGTKNKKNPKGGKNTNRKNKQNKNKNKQNKKQQAEASVMKDAKPDSIWAENIEETILIADTPILQKAKTHEVPKVQANPSSSEPKTQNTGQNLKQKSKNKEEIKMTKDKSMSGHQSKEQLFEGPPKYFNTKKPVDSSKASDCESEKSHTSTKAAVNKSSKRDAPKGKKHHQETSNKNSKPKSSQEEDKRKSQSKVQQNKTNLPQNKKHAHLSNKKGKEEEKVAANSPAQTWDKQHMKKSVSEGVAIGVEDVNSANPQCGYNHSYHDMQDVQYLQSFYGPDAHKYLYEVYLYQTLSKEIDQETQQITIMVNMIQKYRQNIKDQLEKIAIETFQQCHSNVQAHIYGSVATELALPESDMDIMITGVNSFGSKDAHQANITALFDSLNEYFETDILIKSNKILNTQVPIIKLTFNLSKYYDACIKQGKSSLTYINFDSIDSINPHLKELSVDISVSDSFDESAHLGLNQSTFVREKLEQYPVLRPVCLMLKKLLVRNDFNDPYTGGLGSFGLFIMLYAAL